MSSGDTLFPNTIADFLRQREYVCVEHLGKGGFGEVLSAISPKQAKVAIKIVDSTKIWHVEELIWPVLSHKNILPLLEMIDVPNLNVKLFVMPKIPYVLDKVLYSKKFMTDKMGMKKVKKWLSDCQCGLKYLHMSGFAHLDLKEDNILITGDDQALLCDFSGLHMTGVPLRRLIAPLKYRPPEFYDEIRKKNLEGSHCDIWLYGFMTLNILTKDWPARIMGKVTGAQSWKTKVEPVLLEVLKKSTFGKIMKASFPAVSVSDEDIRSAHDFIVSLMQWDSNKRPSVQEIEGHPFLSSLENQSVLIEKIPKFQETKSEVTNPFLAEWINPETFCKNAYVQEYETEKHEQKGVLKNSLQQLKNTEKVIKCDFTNIVTNPFLEGCIGTKVINENTPDQDYEKEKDEENDLNSYSHQLFKKTEITNKCNNMLPIVGESKKNSILISPLDTCAIENELPKEKKKFGRKIKHWFVKKWHKVFKKKKNNYERFSDESEQLL